CERGRGGFFQHAGQSHDGCGVAPGRGRGGGAGLGFAGVVFDRARVFGRRGGGGHDDRGEEIDAGAALRGGADLRGPVAGRGDVAVAGASPAGVAAGGDGVRVAERDDEQLLRVVDPKHAHHGNGDGHRGDARALDPAPAGGEVGAGVFVVGGGRVRRGRLAGGEPGSAFWAGLPGGGGVGLRGGRHRVVAGDRKRLDAPAGAGAGAAFGEFP